MWLNESAGLYQVFYRVGSHWLFESYLREVPFSGETLNGQRLIEFRLGQEGESEQGTGLAVASAELMVRAETSARARHLRYTLWAFTVNISFVELYDLVQVYI